MAKWCMLLLVLAGCTDDEAARHALVQAGLHDVAVGDFAFFGCGRDDFYAQHFRARNAERKLVVGVVCCGVMKGCTVRYDRY